jgi:hypothetical protein
MSKASLTNFERRALQAIIDHQSKYGESITARSFAKAMWPDSPGWDRISNCGPNGATTGKNMPFMAGSHLWRMYRKNLLNPDWRETQTQWSVSDKGRRLLRETVS